METQQSMTKFYLLAALSRKEMHGYELIMQIEKITGKKPSTSQIYPVLNQMNMAGYVTCKAGSVGKKKVKTYKITKLGEKFFSNMSRRFALLIESAIKEKIKVCANCGCEMIKGAYKKNGLYFCCISCASSYKP